MKKLVKQIGYYNDIEDIQYLFDKSADDIADYMNSDFGKFYTLDDADWSIIKGDKIDYTRDGKYAVVKDISENKYDSFIDIYEVSIRRVQEDYEEWKGNILRCYDKKETLVDEIWNSIWDKAKRDGYVEFLEDDEEDIIDSIEIILSNLK